ncbi:glycosyl hydrolase family 28 protein [Phytobacter diazotrophicus]|uniref:glycoside hydrolase family 28 protein n=1 Tax=Phytobacter diazotrophicus TaxID=395631 RepID=UPI0013E9E82C|nr:glycosyl hydrolase family 28 protein [Phytobacter diazotrophicus]MDU7134639.1 glycosyl hydrolase family 28 protein [Enterobacteriaceae bacterium]QIH66065.1 PbsX family transcriptional regulator [Enterobacteriaceae bacterium A-F18]
MSSPLRPLHVRTLTAILLLCAAGAQAGDTRTVTQPVTPPPCQTLYASGTDDATQAIQTALNTCARGKTVHLAAAENTDTFYSGPLSLPSGVSLAIDKGATLRAIANPTRFDTGKQTCGTLDSSGKGCKPFIWIKDAVGSGIYGQGTIDGQGGTVMAGRNQTWWQLAKEAQKSDSKQNAPRLIQIDSSSDITLYQITLKNAPNFHVVGNRSNGLTLWGITIDTPAFARNTDGFDPMGSTNVTLTHSVIGTGDDNVAIKAGNASASHISIVDNRFGSGHGMSIGSEVNKGVSDVDVNQLTLNGTTNGLRIKSDRSRGGLVTGVTYRNICMENVKNPIVLDTRYEPKEGHLLPIFRDITFDHVKVLTAGALTFQGDSDSNPIVTTLKNVTLARGSEMHKKYAIIQGTIAPGPTGSCP